MKLIKNVLLGLALASCAAFASANEITNTFFVPGNMDNPGLLQTYAFSSDLGDGTVPAVGDTFLFDYWFNTVPGSELDPIWFGFNLGEDSLNSIQFTGAAFVSLGDFAPVPNYALSFSNDVLSGFGYVGSGIYDLQLAGTFLVDGGSFSGTAASNIPEPMSLGLMGAGLLGIVGARRRKAA